MSKSQTKSQPKTKIVLTDDEPITSEPLGARDAPIGRTSEPDSKKENVEEEFADYLFRFGKYKLMLASQILLLLNIYHHHHHRYHNLYYPVL